MIRALLILLLLLVVGAYGAWPYYNLQQFDDALERSDEAALAQMVDWTALRSGLGREVAVLRGTEAAPEDGEPPASGSEVLSALLAPAVQDLLVDAYASPQGLRRLLSERQVRLELTAAPASVVAPLPQLPRGTPVDDPEFELALSTMWDYAVAKAKEARVVALLTYQALRVEYDYLFFTGPTSFRAEFTRTPQQSKPLVLIFTLNFDDPGWRLTDILLPSEAANDG